ncbi:hypothetical protein [Paenibacillus terrigena]|uniref:hypothetical protein n=1 Tax=Paenibacillus terrigena TaxID=369333 RepID=UPI00039CCBB2|nr:hypothetical protein [Paenibacillus terrigena]
MMSFYGDEEGVLVLVKEGRHWFPTNEPAISAPVEVIIDEDHVKEIVYGDFRLIGSRVKGTH